ncbi:MAG: type II toxin-antitoxin system Phd/YefM family antitoxin [Acidobacteria bacterium]|nr:type II toxin-antitoxin system Phd/YefM family antitoxin [Acidobacteriota bacterium]
MTKAITAYTLKTQLGRILRDLRDKERFVVLRRNIPVGVLLSVQDFVEQNPDQYEDVEDFLDTLLEESDSAFQRSLKQGAREIKRGRFLTHGELKLALANKKLR